MSAEDFAVETKKHTLWERILEVEDMIKHSNHGHLLNTINELRIHIGFNNITISTTGNVKMSSLSLTDVQSSTLTASLLDALGQEVSGQTIAWASTNGQVVSVTPSADTYSAKVSAVAVGTATVTATSGALSASFEFTVASSGPVSLTLTASPPYLTIQPAPTTVVQEVTPVAV